MEQCWKIATLDPLRQVCATFLTFKWCSSARNLYRRSYVANQVLPYDGRVKEDGNFGRAVLLSSERCQAAIPYDIDHFLRRLIGGVYTWIEMARGNS